MLRTMNLAGSGGIPPVSSVPAGRPLGDADPGRRQQQREKNGESTEPEGGERERSRKPGSGRIDEYV